MDEKESIPKKNNKSNENKRKRFQGEHHRMQKREPRKPFQRENDIYITNKTDFNAQYKKCIEILNSDVGEVFIHCIGNAINRGINLALRLQQEFDVFRIEANTSTIELTDDFHPLRDDDDFAIQKRLNSCLHIRIWRQLLNNSSSALATSSSNTSSKVA